MPFSHLFSKERQTHGLLRLRFALSYNNVQSRCQLQSCFKAVGLLKLPTLLLSRNLNTSEDSCEIPTDVHRSRISPWSSSWVQINRTYYSKYSKYLVSKQTFAAEFGWSLWFVSKRSKLGRWMQPHMVKKQFKKGLHTNKCVESDCLLFPRSCGIPLTQSLLFTLCLLLRISPKYLLEQLIANNEKPKRKSI